MCFESCSGEGCMVSVRFIRLWIEIEMVNGKWQKKYDNSSTSKHMYQQGNNNLIAAFVGQ
jgi:hypothetical protein